MKVGVRSRSGTQMAGRGNAGQIKEQTHSFSSHLTTESVDSWGFPGDSRTVQQASLREEKENKERETEGWRERGGDGTQKRGWSGSFGQTGKQTVKRMPKTKNKTQLWETVLELQSLKQRSLTPQDPVPCL